MNYIEKYYEKIVNHEVIVSVKVRKVYKHLVQNLKNKNSKFCFDQNKADHAIEFIQSYCKHSKGKFGGKPFILELWELALVSAVFGFVNKKTGKRQYREVILIVARKNGKSALGSAISLYMLFADNEKGAEIYSAATKKDQAKIIWNEAVKMIKKSPVLKRRAKCLVSEIKTAFNEGVFKPLSSDSNSLDGLNVHCSLIDELHAIKDKNLYDVIIDGMTAREQPLSIITSTAGTVRECIFDSKYEECEMIINGYEDGSYIDEKTLPIIYELDFRKEWTNPRCWQKANPALGTIKDCEQLADKVEKAKHNPMLVKNLLCKDFNIRETSTEAFLTFEQLNNESKFDITKSKPSYAIGGVDLSITTDLTCATILFKLAADDPNLYIHQMYWIPEDLLEKHAKEDKIPYDLWHKQGLIRTTPGNQVHYKFIVEWFLELQRDLEIYLYKVGYDSWSAKYFVEDMENNFGKSTMQPVIQGKKTLSAPMHSLAAELESNHIIYNNNPVLKWCMANTSIETDKNGNIQPAKQKNKRLRIDGFASLLDAFVIYQDNQEDYLNMI